MKNPAPGAARCQVHPAQPDSAARSESAALLRTPTLFRPRETAAPEIGGASSLGNPTEHPSCHAKTWQMPIDGRRRFQLEGKQGDGVLLKQCTRHIHYRCGFLD